MLLHRKISSAAVRPASTCVETRLYMVIAAATAVVIANIQLQCVQDLLQLSIINGLIQLQTPVVLVFINCSVRLLTSYLLFLIMWNTPTFFVVMWIWTPKSLKAIFCYEQADQKHKFLFNTSIGSITDTVSQYLCIRHRCISAIVYPKVYIYIHPINNINNHTHGSTMTCYHNLMHAQ